MLRGQTHVTNSQGVKIPVIGTQIGTKIIIPPKKQPYFNKKAQAPPKLPTKASDSKNMIHTSSQATFSPLGPHVLNVNHQGNWRNDVKSPAPTLLDCTSLSALPRKESQYNENELLIKSDSKKDKLNPHEQQAAFGMNFGNSTFAQANNQMSKHTASERHQLNAFNQHSPMLTQEKSGSGVIQANSNQAHPMRMKVSQRLSSSLMFAVDPENFNRNHNNGVASPQNAEQFVPKKSKKMQRDNTLNAMSSFTSDEEEDRDLNRASQDVLRELQHGQPTQPQLNSNERADLQTPSQNQGDIKDYKKQISQVKVELHRLIPESAGTGAVHDPHQHQHQGYFQQPHQNYANLKQGTFLLAKDGALVAFQPQHVSTTLNGGQQGIAGMNCLENQYYFNNGVVVSQMANSRPQESTPDERMGSAESVIRALDQIESFDFGKQLELQRLYNSHSPGVREYNKSPLAKLVATPSERFRDMNGHSPKRDKKPVQREVLPLATVNIMSGAVTLEGSTKNAVPSPKAGSASPLPVAQHQNGRQSPMNHKKSQEKSLSPREVTQTQQQQPQQPQQQSLKPPPKKDNSFMLKTVFIEKSQKQAFGAQGMLDSIRDVKVNFRETSFIYKPKVPMMRTTLAIKDEQSSDTVSTEFNYLQPAVRRLELNQRASIQTSSQGGVIHVLENNIASECTSDLRKDSIGMQNPLSPQSPSPHPQVDSSAMVDSSMSSHLRKLYMDQHSQILFDAPASQATALKAQQLQIQKQSRDSPTQQTMRPQLSNGKLASMPVKKVNTNLGNRNSPMSKEHKSPRQRQVSRLSVDMRPDQGPPQKKNDDLKTYMMQNEPNTVVLVKSAAGGKASPLKGHKSLTRDSTLKGPNAAKIQQTSSANPMDEVKQLLREKSNVIVPLDTLMDASDYGIIKENLKKTLNQDNSSQLLQQEASMKNMNIEMDINRSLSPTKIVVGHTSKLSKILSEVGRSSSLNRELKETYQFRPKELQVFDMPNLEKKKSSNDIMTRSGPSSPRLFKKDISNASLRRMQKQHSKKVLETNPSQKQIQMSQKQSPSRTKKTIDVSDERLKVPNMLLTARSNTDIDEYKELANNRDAHQSFATARQSIQNEKDSICEQKNDSKMSRFMPVLFNSEFSKTYADLLKNVAPLERKSEATESDYTLYPVLGDTQRKNIEGIRIEAKNNLTLQQLPLSPIMSPIPTAPMNTELQFFKEVLERIKNSHKDVVSDEQIKENRNQYRKYLAQENQGTKGIFSELERKKIIKPTITLSNEDSRDPELHKLKTERNLYLQYNLAAIKAQGTEKLPNEWKMISPLNRFKSKLRVQKLRNKAIDENNANQDSPTQSPRQARQKSQLVEQTAADTMMFKSLISSQEFSLARLEANQSNQRVSPGVLTQQSQAILSRENDKNLTKVPKHLLPGEQSISVPASKVNLRAQMSQSLDFGLNKNQLRLKQANSSSRNDTKMGDNFNTINVLPLGAHQDKSRHAKAQAFASLQALNNRVPNLGMSDFNFAKNLKQKQTSPSLANMQANMRYCSNSMQLTTKKQPTSPGVGKSALINVQSWQDDDDDAQEDQVITQGSPMLQNSVLIKDSRDEHHHTLSAAKTYRSVDPSANPQNPSQKLAQQRSCFADVLSFKGAKPKNLKARVGQHGHNPFLEEIEERLRNPEMRSHSLAKSLAIRTYGSDGDDKWRQYQTKPKVGKDKTIKIALKDIYQSIKGQKSIPPVALHRMDKITRNLTESLLEETAGERVKMSEWKKQEVMLPILNTVHRNVTLHTTEDLQTTDIRRQKMIQKKAGSERVSNDRKARKQAIQSRLEQLNDDQANQRATSQLSLMSITLSTPEQSSRQAISPLPKSTFKNQMLRKATEMTSYEKKGPMKIIQRASRQNFNYLS